MKPILTWAMLALIWGTTLQARAEESTNALPLWFPVGESFAYKVYWGVIPVGYAFTTNEWIEEDGRKLLAIRIRTKSNSVIATLYPVDDQLESIIDPETFLPVRFTKKLSEGRYRAHQRTTFDHKNLTARWEALDEGDDREETFPIEADTRDLLSLMYWIRKEGITPDKEIYYRVMADEKMYELITKRGETEKVKLANYGKVNSIKIEPEGKFQGLFVRKGRMWVWVSDDPRCVITKAAVRVPVASVNLYLLEVGGPGDDFWITTLAAQKDRERAVEEEETESKPSRRKPGGR